MRVVYKDTGVREDEILDYRNVWRTGISVGGWREVDCK